MTRDPACMVSGWMKGRIIFVGSILKAEIARVFLPFSSMSAHAHASINPSAAMPIE